MTPDIPIEQFEIFASGVDHSECVAFDRDGNLWAGGEAGQVYRIAPDGKPEVIADLGSFSAGIAFSPVEEDLFVCNPNLGIVRVKKNGKWDVFASHYGNHKLVCPNYGLFDSKGNYYVTDSGLWKERSGYLIRYNSEGGVLRRPNQGQGVAELRPPGNDCGEILSGPFEYTNGLALSADEKFLFMVESKTDSVYRFEIRSNRSLGPAELYADQCGRFPDGLTLDADGNLYVCCYASDEIWRVSPSRKKTLFAWDRWAIKLGSPTNMAFGGKNLDELYFANLARTTITRAKVGRKGQPLANQKVK